MTPVEELVEHLQVGGEVAASAALRRHRLVTGRNLVEAVSEHLLGDVPVVGVEHRLAIAEQDHLGALVVDAGLRFNQIAGCAPVDDPDDADHQILTGL